MIWWWIWYEQAYFRILEVNELVLDVKINLIFLGTVLGNQKNGKTLLFLLSTILSIP